MWSDPLIDKLYLSIKLVDDALHRHPLILFSLHAYKFVSWKYLHDLTFPVQLVNQLHFLINASQMNGGGCEELTFFNICLFASPFNIFQNLVGLNDFHDDLGIKLLFVSASKKVLVCHPLYILLIQRLQFCQLG